MRRFRMLTDEKALEEEAYRRAYRQMPGNVGIYYRGQMALTPGTEAGPEYELELPTMLAGERVEWRRMEQMLKSRTKQEKRFKLDQDDSEAEWRLNALNAAIKDQSRNMKNSSNPFIREAFQDEQEDEDEPF